MKNLRWISAGAAAGAAMFGGSLVAQPRTADACGPVCMAAHRQLHQCAMRADGCYRTYQGARNAATWFVQAGIQDPIPYNSAQLKPRR